jgi:hypothetical protein
MGVAVPEVLLSLLKCVEVGIVDVGKRHRHDRSRCYVDSGYRRGYGKLRRQRRSVTVHDAASVLCVVILLCDVRSALVETRMKMLYNARRAENDEGDQEEEGIEVLAVASREPGRMRWLVSADV